MELDLWRIIHQKETTFGFLDVNNQSMCWTLEDEFRTIKVPGETRIAAGRYEIKIRTEGGMFDRYKRRFGKRHRGMLWLQDVPNFEYIYIHPGYDHKDTDGCIIVGYISDLLTGTVTLSSDAYLRLCDLIYQALDVGEKVFINIMDHIGNRGGA